MCRTWNNFNSPSKASGGNGHQWRQHQAVAVAAPHLHVPVVCEVQVGVVALGLGQLGDRVEEGHGCGGGGNGWCVSDGDNDQHAREFCQMQRCSAKGKRVIEKKTVNKCQLKRHAQHNTTR